VIVLGASFDSVEDNAAFARKYDFKFPLLCDVERTLAIAYGACKDPRARHPARMSVLIGEQGVITRIYDAVNPRDHASQVLVDLMES
jgi:peroxiredoxin Q/BCP